MMAAAEGGRQTGELRGQAPHQEDMPVRNRQPVVLSYWPSNFGSRGNVGFNFFGSCMVEQYLRLY